MTFPRSLHDLVVGPGHEPARRALSPFYKLRRGTALCRIPPAVAEKYGQAGQEQHILTVTDRLLHRQTCWNPQRGNKPQNFVSASSASAASAAASASGSASPSGGGGGKSGVAFERPRHPHHALDPLLRFPGRSCDFCAPLESTAEDVPFGRVAAAAAAAGGGAVSASNLFKCAAPYHGLVVLTRRHDPLAFRRRDVADLLECAAAWFGAAAASGAAAAAAADADAASAGDAASAAAAPSSDPGGAYPPRLHPFLLWNALPRAGASQYHGHAQTALTEDPVPEQGALWRAERAFAGAAGGGGEGENGPGGGGGGESDKRCYYASLLRAKEAAGLLRVVTAGATSGSASARPLMPTSLQWAASLEPRGASAAAAAPPVAYVYASLAPVKDAELVVVVPRAAPAAPPRQGGEEEEGSEGEESALGSLRALRSPALARALHAALRAVVDGVGGGSGAFNAAVHNLEVVGPWRDEGDEDEAPPPWAGGGGGGGGGGAALFPGGRPVVARVVSRGPPSAVASDYGALEVMGGASIGHTDPYALMALFDAALEAADGWGEDEEEEAEEMAATTTAAAAAASTAAAEEEGQRE